MIDILSIILGKFCYYDWQNRGGYLENFPKLDNAFPKTYFHDCQIDGMQIKKTKGKRQISKLDRKVNKTGIKAAR